MMGLYDKIQRSGNAPAQGDDLQPQSALNQHSDASAAAREEPLKLDKHIPPAGDHFGAVFEQLV